MEKEKFLFSRKFDSLFEEPQIKIFNSKKEKLLSLIAVIVIARAAMAPAISLIIVIKNSQHLLELSSKRMDRIKNSLPYTEEKLLEKNIFLNPKPNYSQSKYYKLSLKNEGIDFGNGYELKVNSSLSLNKEYSNPDLKVKAVSDEDASSDLLAMYNTKGEEYNSDYELPENVTVFISGNLISTETTQLSKTPGSWATVLPLKKIDNKIYSGYILNYVEEGNDGMQDRSITIKKYWIFPDGVGMEVRETFLMEDKVDKREFIRLNLKEQLEFISKVTKGKFESMRNNLNLIRKTK